MNRVFKFVKNPAAEEQHSLGLDISTAEGALMPQLRQGQAHYLTGINIVNGEGHGLDPESQTLQSARLLRDLGAVMVKQALRPRPINMRVQAMEISHRNLLNSRNLSQKLKDLRPGHYSPEAWRHLRAEHGATGGVLARWGTVSVVLFDDAPIDPDELYEEVHVDLEKGDNRYFEISNASRGELQAVIEGKKWRASVWHNRATKALDKAKKEGGPNYVAGQATFQNIQLALYDTKTAKEYVKRRP